MFFNTEMLQLLPKSSTEMLRMQVDRGFQSVHILNLVHFNGFWNNIDYLLLILRYITFQNAVGICQKVVNALH